MLKYEQNRSYNGRVDASVSPVRAQTFKQYLHMLRLRHCDCMISKPSSEVLLRTNKRPYTSRTTSKKINLDRNIKVMIEISKTLIY